MTRVSVPDKLCQEKKIVSTLTSWSMQSGQRGPPPAPERDKGAGAEERAKEGAAGAAREEDPLNYSGTSDEDCKAYLELLGQREKEVKTKRKAHNIKDLLALTILNMEMIIVLKMISNNTASVQVQLFKKIKLENICYQSWQQSIYDPAAKI